MKLASFFSLALLLAASAFAQLTPGVVVDHSQRFPLIADFNGDGLDDIFNDRTVILNNGSSFGEPRDLGIGAYEEIIGLLDVNGDHIPDLLTYNGPLDHTYRLYVADALRHYGKPVVIGTSLRPHIADVDADGKDDLVFMVPVRAADGFHNIATDFTVLRSRGDGTFDNLLPVRIPAGDPQTLDSPRLLMGDLDHDGIADIVLRCPTDLAVLRGLGGGRFAAEMRFLPGAQTYHHATDDPWGWWNTRLADIDGDGNLDVVSVGLRTIHVLFGDGHRNFPRHAWVKVAQSSPTPASPVPFPMDQAQQPRDIAIGHFTRSDRNEIAADTLEGDLITFAYEQGVLTETSRTETGFPFLLVEAGNFRGSALTDLIAYTSDDMGERTPPPVIFHGNAQTAAVRAEPRTVVRRRTSAPRTPSRTVLHLETHAQCYPDTSQDFVFQRDGMFAHAENGDAFFDGNDVYFRLPVPGFPVPLEGVLTRDGNGVYSGSQMAVCGYGGDLIPLTYTATVSAPPAR